MGTVLVMPSQPHRLNELVLASDVPVKRIAAACDVTTDTLGRWRRGDNPIPSDKLPILADTLGVSITTMMGWDTARSEQAA